jgi:membrane protease YdiL (CAAX protease family)
MTQTRWHRLHQGFGNYHLIEVLVFLFLIVPSMVLSFLAIGLGRVDFISMAIATIIRDLALVNLVIYFIWRNGESFRQLGWSLTNGWRDLGLGLALFLPFTYGAIYLKWFLKQAGLSVPAGPPPAFLSVHGLPEIFMGLVLVIIVALAEETIFRGYLLLRFQGAGLRPLAAALLSSVIFSLGHGYEGAAGVVTVGAMGMVFALIFLWRGSLVAPIVMHFLQDFAGIVLPALLR